MTKKQARAQIEMELENIRTMYLEDCTKEEIETIPFLAEMKTYYDFLTENLKIYG